MTAEPRSRRIGKQDALSNLRAIAEPYLGPVDVEALERLLRAQWPVLSLNAHAVRRHHQIEDRSTVPVRYVPRRRMSSPSPNHEGN